MVAAMSNKPNLIGQVIHARDGGLHAPLDRAGLDYVQAQSAEGGRKMEVKGTALRYGVVGHFGMWGALRVAAGAIVEAPGRHPRYRAVLGLYSHQSASVLASVGNQTMGVEYGEEQVTYWMMLNPNDPEAQSVWAKLVRGDVAAASVGIMIVDGEWTEGYDNGLDAADGEKIDIFEVTEAELVEISLVAAPAFAGATSMPAGADLPTVGEIATAVVTGAIVGGDGTEQEREQPATGGDADASADIPEGDTGDDPDGFGTADGGAAEPDDGDNGRDGAAAVAEEAQRELTAWLQDQEDALRERGISI